MQKILPNNIYIVRRLNTNKTQILHRIRLKKFVPNASLEDKYRKGKLHPDEVIVIPQDDLYTISGEIDFDYELFETTKDNWPAGPSPIVAYRRLAQGLSRVVSAFSSFM